MTTDPRPCTVYGDHETVTALQDQAATLAGRLGLQPVAWFDDPTGLRGMRDPSYASGLVAALANCAAGAMPLLVPFPGDAPGEQHVRLVAHWLDRHGLQLFHGQREYLWSLATDEVDFAIRRLLDASTDLASAVAVAAQAPDFEHLAYQLIRGQRRSGTAMESARGVAARCRANGDLVPAEPDGHQPWHERLRSVHAYAHWLARHTSQQLVADALNELGVRTRAGRLWTQPAISRLLHDQVRARRSA